MDQAEIEKLVNEKVEAAKAEWDKTRGWRHDRWESIKKDPQAAAVCAAVGAAGVYFWPLVAKLL